MECKYCNEQLGNLISPCKCNGTQKWVHRECLDEWRTKSSNKNSLTNCTECGYRFEMERTSNEEEDARSRNIKYKLLIMRDSLIVFIIFQICIMITGYLVWKTDDDEYIKKHVFHFMEEDTKTIYYMAGVFFFFVAIGVSLIIVAIILYLFAPHNGGGSVIIINNSPSSCGLSGVSLILVSVLFFLIGLFFVGACVISIMGQKIAEHYADIYLKRKLIETFRVKDLNENLV